MNKIVIPVRRGINGAAICSVCGKQFEPEPLLVRDCDLCPECRKTYKDMAFAYCMKCKAVVTRIPAGIMMGLIVKPGDILHVTECPVCTPGVIRSVPIEVQKLNKK